MGGLRFRGKITENKKPDSGESGLAVENSFLVSCGAGDQRLSIVAKPTRASVRI